MILTVNAAVTFEKEQECVDNRRIINYDVKDAFYFILYSYEQ